MGQVVPLQPLPAWLDAELWADFLQHRIELGKPLTPTAERRCLRKLERWHADPEVDAMQQLEHSIEMGWRGLYLADLSSQSTKPARQMSESELLTACAAKGLTTRGRSRKELECLL